MIYFWETWPYAWKQNILFYLFIYVLPKTGYFNTKLVSLQYKNTNRCWLKYRRKQKNHRFLKHFFYYYYFIFFIWAGPVPTHVAGLDPATLRSWAGPDQPSLVTGPCQWPAHPSPCTRNILRVHEQCEGNLITFALFIILFTVTEQKERKKKEWLQHWFPYVPFSSLT